MGGSENCNILLNKQQQQHIEKKRDVPKGCLAIKVGGEGEEQQRVIVPVVYFNHPMFLNLLKQAEDEYGFDQKGTFTIPCRLDHFRFVQSLIHNQRHRRRHRHHHLVARCFRVNLN